jgi:hypothetical protein
LIQKTAARLIEHVMNKRTLSKKLDKLGSRLTMRSPAVSKLREDVGDAVYFATNYHEVFQAVNDIVYKRGASVCDRLSSRLWEQACFTECLNDRHLYEHISRSKFNIR